MTNGTLTVLLVGQKADARLFRERLTWRVAHDSHWGASSASPRRWIDWARAGWTWYCWLSS